MLTNRPLRSLEKAVPANGLAAHFTVRVAVLLPPFAAAVTCTVVAWDTGLVSTVQVPVVLPAGTVTVAGMEENAEPPVRIVKVMTVSLA